MVTAKIIVHSKFSIRIEIDRSRNDEILEKPTVEEISNVDRMRNEIMLLEFRRKQTTYVEDVWQKFMQQRFIFIECNAATMSPNQLALSHTRWKIRYIMLILSLKGFESSKLQLSYFLFEQIEVERFCLFVSNFRVRRQIQCFEMKLEEESNV